MRLDDLLSTPGSKTDCYKQCQHKLHCMYKTANAITSTISQGLTLTSARVLIQIHFGPTGLLMQEHG